MKSKSLLISLLAILLGVFLTAFSPKILAKGNSKNTSTDLGWYSRGPVNIGGAINAVLVDNLDASNNTIYIGSKVGGLWKSTNGGTSWGIIEYNENLCVTSMVQTSNGDIYIGTGGDFIGTGLYKLTNNVITPINNTQFTSINDIACKGNTIYLATNEGLKYYDGSNVYTCTENGTELLGNVIEVQVNNGGKIIANMDKICYISSGSNDGFVNQSTGATGKLPLPSTLGSIAIASDNADDNLFYASLVKAAGTLNGIYLTSDGGNTWEVILQGSGSIDPFLYDGIKFGLVHNKIYSVNHVSGYNAVYVGGHDLWYGFRPIGSTGYFDFGTNAVTYSGIDYNNVLYLHSYVNDIAIVDPYSAYLVTDGGIYKSSYFIPSAGYISFTKLNITLNNTLVNKISVDGDNNMILGTDHTSVLSLGKNQNSETLAKPIWTASSGSDSYSLEGTSTFSFSSLININFILYSRTDHAGTFSLRRSDDTGYSFEDITTDDMSGLTDLVYWETLNANYIVDTVVFNAYMTTDSTSSTHYNNWAPGDIVWGYSNHKYSGTNQYPIPYELQTQLSHGDSVLIPDPIQSRTFAAMGKSLYMTADILNMSVTPTWTKIATLSENIVKIGLSANCEDVYFASLSGKLYRISNIDAYYVYPENTYDAVEIANFDGQTVSSIFVDKESKDKVIVTLSTSDDDYIFRSTNATSDNPEFNSIQYNLPAIPIYTSLIPMNDQSSTNMPIIGTDNGIYSFNGSFNGSAWVIENLPNIKVTDLIQQTNIRVGLSVPVTNPNPSDTLNPFIYNTYPASKNNGCIYASTYGRGVYQTDIYKTAPVVSIPCDDLETTLNSLKLYPNPVSYYTNIEIESNINQNGVIQIFDLQGRCLSTENIYLQSGTNTHEMNFSNYNTGIYLVRIVYGSISKTAKVIKN